MSPCDFLQEDGIGGAESGSLHFFGNKSFNVGRLRAFNFIVCVFSCFSNPHSRLSKRCMTAALNSVQKS